MRIILALPGIMLLLAIGASSSAHADRSIRLTVGQSHTLAVRGAITKVQVLDPRIADVATYTTKIMANHIVAPVLLSNGNLVDQGQLDDGREY